MNSPSNECRSARLAASSALSCPFPVLSLGHEFHEVVVGELRRMLLKVSPRRFERFVLPPELRQQFTLKLVQCVTCRRPKLHFPIEGATAFNPRQRLARLLCCK